MAAAAAILVLVGVIVAAIVMTTGPVRVWLDRSVMFGRVRERRSPSIVWEIGLKLDWNNAGLEYHDETESGRMKAGSIPPNSCTHFSIAFVCLLGSDCSEIRWL